MVDKYVLAKAKDEDILACGECGGAVSAIFKYLLDTDSVDGVLTLSKGNDVYDGIPTYLEDSKDIAKTSGSLHCAPTLFGEFIKNHLNEDKIAVAVKPCDAMSIKELDKRVQLDTDNMYLIGLNCGGTVSPLVARNMIELFYNVDPAEVVKEEIAKGKFIIELANGEEHEVSIDDLEDDGYGRRGNCQRCELKVPRNADIACGNWGAEDGWTFIEICTDKGSKLIENAEEAGFIELKKPSDKSIAIREKIENVMINMGKKAQKNQLYDNYETPEEWESYWDRCIKCYGCRDVCPICYCVECSLEKEHYVPKDQVPPSYLTFQGIKLAHMGFSCINCGQCEDVCPSEIPLSKIYQKVQDKYKQENDFVAGVDEELPPLFSPEKEDIEE